MQDEFTRITALHTFLVEVHLVSGRARVINPVDAGRALLAAASAAAAAAARVVDNDDGLAALELERRVHFGIARGQLACLQRLRRSADWILCQIDDLTPSQALSRQSKPKLKPCC